MKMRAVLGVAATVLAFGGTAAAQQENPCAAIPGAALMVEIQSGHVVVPRSYGIGPNWVMAVHPGLPQAPFLVPPGWQPIMLEPALHTHLIRLVSPDRRAEVDWLFGSLLIHGIVGTTPRQIASQAVLGNGQQLTVVCGWDFVQPGPVGVAVVAAEADGVVRVSEPFVYPDPMHGYSAVTATAPAEDLLAVVQGVLVPVMGQFSDAGGKSSPSGDPCPAGQILRSGECQPGDED